MFRGPFLRLRSGQKGPPRFHREQRQECAAPPALTTGECADGSQASLVKRMRLCHEAAKIAEGRSERFLCSQFAARRSAAEFVRARGRPWQDGGRKSTDKIVRATKTSATYSIVKELSTLARRADEIFSSLPRWQNAERASTVLSYSLRPGVVDPYFHFILRILLPISIRSGTPISRFAFPGGYFDFMT